MMNDTEAIKELQDTSARHEQMLASLQAHFEEQKQVNNSTQQILQDIARQLEVISSKLGLSYIENEGSRDSITKSHHVFDELTKPTYNEIVKPLIQYSKGNEFQNDAATMQDQFLQLLSRDDSIEEEDADKFKEVSDDEVLVQKLQELEESGMVLGITWMNTLGLVTMNFAKSVLKFNLDGGKHQWQGEVAASPQMVYYYLGFDDKASEEEIILDVELQELLEYFEDGTEPTRCLFVQETGYSIVFDPGGKSITGGAGSIFNLKFSNIGVVANNLHYGTLKMSISATHIISSGVPVCLHTWQFIYRVIFFSFDPGGNTSVARDGVVSIAGISDTIEEKWFAMNHFEGHISLWLNDATQMYLQINSFPGSVPNNIAELMLRLHTLFLCYNQIRGRLRALICKMKRMEFLFVGHNIIIAKLPDCWNNLKSLKVIDASNIGLSGEILNPLISSYLLIVLMLDDDSLRMNISFSLYGCRQVSWIYVLQLRPNLLEGINNFTQPKTWYQFQPVLLVSLEIFLIFVIQALIKIGLRDQNERRDSWHHGGWTTKMVAWILLVIPVIFLPFLVITVYETLSESCVVLHPRGNDSVLLAVVILVYLAFGCYTSLSSEPRDNVCSGRHYKSSIVSTGTLIIEMLKSSIIYSALRAGSLTPFLAPPPSSRAGFVPLILSSMILLNHLMLSYNNLSRRIPTRNQPQMLNDPSNYEDISPLNFFQDVDPKDKLGPYLSIIMGFIVEFGSVCGTLEIVALKAPSFRKHKSHYLVSIAILMVGIVMRDEVEKYALVEIDKITLEVISGSMRIEKINLFKVLGVSRNHFQLLVLQEFDSFFPVHFDGAVFQLVIYEDILHTYPILNLEDKVLFEGGGNVMDRTHTIEYGQPGTAAKRKAQQLNQQPNMGPKTAGSEPMRLHVYVSTFVSNNKCYI